MTVARVPAVVYGRVSSVGQADRGGGLGVQLAAGDAWCGEHGRRVVARLSDEGVPGTLEAFERRTALLAALELLRTGRAAELVVYRLDRVARELFLQEAVLALVIRNGGRLRSTVAAEDALLADDPADPTRALLRQVLGAVGQYERALARLRMRAGFEAKRAAGGYAAGRPPFGYRAAAGQLETDPAARAAVALIRRRHTAGASLRVIAAELDSRPDTARPGGRSWHPQTVARVARRLSQPAKP